jgi:uncharacterized protein YhhL (DUF1145 family)
MVSREIAAEWIMSVFEILKPFPFFIAVVVVVIVIIMVIVSTHLECSF